MKVWLAGRIIVPLALLLTFSGCIGDFFGRPDYATLVVDSIEETYDGIRIRVQNIGDQEAQIASVLLIAKNSLGAIVASEAPTSRQDDEAWFRGVELREVSPGNFQQFIPVGSLVEGWAFEDAFDSSTGIITEIQVEIKWVDSTFTGELSKSYPLPFYRTGDPWEGEDE